MPPKSPLSQRTGGAQSTPPRPARTTLTDAETEQLGRLMQNSYGWSNPPHPFQLAGVKAQLEGVDAIIQAPTGSGKTAIAAGPHLWPTAQGKTSILVSPLLALQTEMVETFAKEFKLRAVAINSSNGGLTPPLIKARDILNGQFQIILISPEMLQSRSFKNAILRNPRFMSHVLSMVIDEAHCISHWGADFRKKYNTLGVIRAFLPRGTPVIALSATLTRRVRRDIHSKLHFPKQGSLFLNEGNDRNNVSIIVRACQHPMNTYADLDFVLPQTIRSPQDIPKTYIYVDNINTGSEIIDHLEDVLTQRVVDTTSNQSSAMRGLIRPFNATMSFEYRKVAMERFRTGDLRIMVCTDAAGMGCNIPDIDVVVLWKLPSIFSSVIQRMGRAVRARGRTGIAVLLVERAIYSQLTGQVRARRTRRKPDQSQGPPAARKTKEEKAQSKMHALAHGVMRGGSDAKMDTPPQGQQPELDPDAADEGLLTFVQSVTCRRKVWAEAFDAPLNLEKNPLLVPCCDICEPKLFDRTRPGVVKNRKRAKVPTKGTPNPAAQQLLLEWRNAIFTSHYTFSQLDPSAILEDSTIVLLASVSALTHETFRGILEPTWIWWGIHGDALWATVQKLYEVQPVEKNTARARKRGPDAMVNNGPSRAGDKTSRPGPSKRTRLSSGYENTPSQHHITSSAPRQGFQFVFETFGSPVSHSPSAMLNPLPPTPSAPLAFHTTAPAFSSQAATPSRSEHEALVHSQPYAASSQLNFQVINYIHESPADHERRRTHQQ